VTIHNLCVGTKDLQNNTRFSVRFGVRIRVRVRVRVRVMVRFHLAVMRRLNEITRVVASFRHHTED